MTVCIAALADKGTVVLGSADRLLTGLNDVGHEPKIPKIELLTDGIIILKSGIDVISFEISNELKFKLAQIKNKNPNTSITIKEVVDLYIQIFSETINGYAFRNYISTLQMTLDEYKEAIKHSDSAIIRDIHEKIVNLKHQEIFNVGAIIAGYDINGPHIVEMDRDTPLWHTGQGYATIGSGSFHAESQIQNAKYSPSDSFSKVMLTTWFAKKRAEISRSVGPSTDMFYIFKGSNTFKVFEVAPDSAMEDYYNELKSAEEIALKEALGKIKPPESENKKEG